MKKDNSKNKKPTKQPAKKPKAKSQKPVVDCPEVPAELDTAILSDAETEALFRDTQRIVSGVEMKASRVNDASRVASMLSEYYDTYVILAYDMYGNRVMLQKTKGPAEVDAMQRFAEITVGSGQIVKNAGMQRWSEDGEE